jgi:uncharacterized protein (TIGR02246 family)
MRKSFAPGGRCTTWRAWSNWVRALPILTTLAGALAVAPRSALAQHAGEVDIRSVAMEQADTWNRHDAKAYAALFTEDCDVVNVVGWWWKGRAEVERKLTAAFRSVFRDSRLTITDVSTRFLAPDIAVTHARWTMVGAKTPQGIPEPRQGIQTLVLAKHAGRWLIAAFQNTHTVPERPFPTGPGERSPGKR